MEVTAEQVTYFGDLMKESEAAVRDQLEEDEEVVAVGRCADITTTGDLDSAGAGWTFVMVSNTHVHWVPQIRELGSICSLGLDDVRDCAEIHWRHRSAIVLDHDPLVRLHFAPNGRQQHWSYTAMDLVVGPLSNTILGFSRPTATASERLKGQLLLRRVEIRQVHNENRIP